MNIHCILITYVLEVRTLIESMDGPDVTWHVFVHSHNQDVFNSILDTEPKRPMELYDYFENRGLATSWNEGIINAQKMGAEAIIIVNDDVTGTHADLLKLAQGCVDHPEAGIIVAEGYNERMTEHQILQFAVFGINPVAIQQIGYFDQNFTPIYFEDTDYSRRVALASVKFHNVGETGMIHKGSATIQTSGDLYRQNNVTFQANHNYYCKKWGGSPGDEEFTFPFDAAMYNLRISAEERHNPYPDHRRTDLEIVKI